MPLLIVGSVGIDDIITQEGEARNVLGGSASYAAVAAGYFDRVNLVGIVGSDFPEEYIELYEKSNIDLTGLEIVKDGKTFRWTGKYHENFKNRDTLEIHLNVFETFRPKIPAAYRSTPFVLLANIDPELQLMVLDQIQKPIFTAADTMNLWLDIKRDKVLELIKKVDLIVLNDEESEQLTGELNVIKAGRKVLDMGCQYVIIKKGSNGAVLFAKDSIFQIPAYPLEKVVDPTGAGDCFIGGLMGCLASTGKATPENIRKGIAYGTAIAAANVEAYSLNNLRIFPKPLVEKRVAELKAMTEF